MCGINGILSFRKKENNFEQIKNMNKSLSHRGPDNEDVYMDSNISLGSRRLAIFDTSVNGNQPMLSACGKFVIVFNGAIYNWPEIRKTLKNNAWRSNTDTETILQAYIEKGMSFLDDLVGIFAIAIWDKINNNLILARDRLGVKPIFFYKDNETFLFSSETKGIYSANFFTPNINYARLYDFLKWGLIDNGQETLHNNISEVDAGYYMLISKNGNIKKKKYWCLEDFAESEGTINCDTAVNEFKELLLDSIKKNIRSDVRIGMFSSGGLDSNIVLSLTKKYLENIHSFTYDFMGSKVGEAEIAKKLSAFINVNHTSSFIDSRDIPKLFDELIIFQELPITSIRVLGAFNLCKVARQKGYKIIIDGNGGDQVSGGFEYYWLSAVKDTMIREGFDEGYKQFEMFLSLYNIQNKDISKKLLQYIFSSESPGVTTTDGVPIVDLNFFCDDFKNQYKNRFPIFMNKFKSNLQNFQFNDIKNNNLKRILRMNDRCSMANGIEQRVPLLDHRLVELAFKIEDKAKIRNNQQRYYMVVAAEELLKKINFNKTKQTIVDPQRQWFRKELKNWVLSILDNAESSKDVFNISYIKSYFENYYCKTRNPQSSFQLFQFINTVIWREKVMKSHAVK